MAKGNSLSKAAVLGLAVALSGSACESEPAEKQHVGSVSAESLRQESPEIIGITFGARSLTAEIRVPDHDNLDQPLIMAVAVDGSTLKPSKLPEMPEGNQYGSFTETLDGNLEGGETVTVSLHLGDVRNQAVSVLSATYEGDPLRETPQIPE